jgi:putative transposase
VKSELGLSERRICRVLGQHRSTQRRLPTTADDEAALTADIIALACKFGRYGYPSADSQLSSIGVRRRIAALLANAGWVVNIKRVRRIWRREGLKVPSKQPKKGRLWLNDGSCVRLRPEYPNHVWSYDFVEDRTHDGRKYRMLNIIDEFTRECLAIRVSRRLKSTDVIDTLADLFILRGIPAYIRSDNGPEFIAIALRKWITDVGAKTAYIEPGSPWENGYCESFNSKLRDELLNGEIFYSLHEAKVIIEGWRNHYNRASEHPSGYVIEGNRFCWSGCDPAGYFGFCRARSVIDRAAGVIRSLRAKIQGPSASGWIALISPASAASRRVFGAILRILAASERLSQGSMPFSAALNTGMR